MTQLTDEQRSVFADAVREAAGRDDVRLAIECTYQQLQDAIELRQPRCDASGRCCRFEAYGHRLFVTTAELALFLSQTTLVVPDGPGCPYQLGWQCSVHGSRPFGCRIFFCDPTADAWQKARYETTHRQLRTIHDQLGVPYYYVEWREALGAVAGRTSNNRPACMQSGLASITSQGPR